MLVRLFAGFLHPFIHIGYGIEFKQPALIAEGLALASTSGGWMEAIFFAAEKKAKENGEERKSMVELMAEIRNDAKLRNAPKFTDGNKIKAILERAPEELLRIVSQYKVKEDELELRMAENINAAGE
jgi:hypothetical protein